MCLEVVREGLMCLEIVRYGLITAVRVIFPPSNVWHYNGEGYEMNKSSSAPQNI